eukprot:gene2060-biopygen3409
MNIKLCRFSMCSPSFEVQAKRQRTHTGRVHKRLGLAVRPKLDKSVAMLRRVGPGLARAEEPVLLNDVQQMGLQNLGHKYVPAKQNGRKYVPAKICARVAAGAAGRNYGLRDPEAWTTRSTLLPLTQALDIVGRVLVGVRPLVLGDVRVDLAGGEAGHADEDVYHEAAAWRIAAVGATFPSRVQDLRIPLHRQRYAACALCGRFAAVRRRRAPLHRRTD